MDNEGHSGAANDLGQMTISGGTLNGKIYVVGAGASLAVTGGTFSDPSALAYLGDNADITVKLDTDTRLTKTMIVEKGAATIDLNNHRLTADASATIKIKENGDDVVVAVAVKDGAKVMVKNGNIGDSSNKLSYGVYAFGKADVTLNNVGFSEMVIYAYNGAGKLAATDCIFKGWLSGWHHGGAFAGCTLPSVRRGIRQQFVTEALLLPTVNSSRTRWMPMFMMIAIRLTVTAIIVVAT